jgi:diguanylate cyclase (GGDEF)-like protein/PAS domain S-box-containing protein
MADEFLTKHFPNIYEPLQEKLHLGYWSYNLDAGHIDWSSGVHRIHGTDPGSFHPDLESAVGFYISDDRPRITGLLNELIESDRNFEEILRIKRRDGEIRQVRVIAYKGREDDSELVYGIIQDVHDAATASEEAEMLAAVSKRTKEGILISDPKGKAIWVNEGLLQLTGYSRKELLGNRPGRLLQGKDTDKETVRAIRRALKAQQAIQTEILNYRKDGTSYWLQLDIQPYFGENGELKYYLAVETDVTAQHRKLSRLSDQVRRQADARRFLEQEAHTDELTRAGNRKHLGKVWDDLMLDRRYQNIALLVLDIDHFKAVNDEHGHAVGDEVLKSFSGVIADQLRQGDYFFRIGGEEFLVLICGIDEFGANRIAERFRKAVEKHRIEASGGLDLTITVSIGVALWQRNGNGPHESYDDLFKRADQRLYNAKEGGRNQVVGA